MVKSSWRDAQRCEHQEQCQGTLPRGPQDDGCETILSKTICTAEIKILDLGAFSASPLPSDRLEMFWLVRLVCLQGDVQMSVLINVTLAVHFGKIVTLKLVLWAWLLCAHYWGSCVDRIWFLSQAAWGPNSQLPKVIVFWGDSERAASTLNPKISGPTNSLWDNFFHNFTWARLFRIVKI